MAKRELRDAYIRTLKVSARTEISDSKEAGLLLRAFPTGKKTFALRLRGSDGRIQNAIIGQYPDIKLVEARAKTEELRRRVREGADVTAATERVAAATAAELQRGIPTLGIILDEYAAEMSAKRKIWQKTGTGKRSEAWHRIEAVFGKFLNTRISEIGLGELARSMNTYLPESGKTSANGQVSKARAYLMPVLDWCSHRNRFNKIGLGRPGRLDVADLRQTHDPASDDNEITGFRDRALDHHELARILPLLIWPAPPDLETRVGPEADLRPIALRFLLLTCARVGELQRMRWRDFRENSGAWHKPYVKTISGAPRQQSLPLSDAAITLLGQLPGFAARRPDDLVFPNSEGGPLGNWTRITKAIHTRSQTGNWHRHDLRRTGATIMRILGTAPRTIDQILAHKASHKDEGTSRALESYFASSHILDHVADPQKVALDQLASALDHIEAEAAGRATGRSIPP